MTLLAMAVTGVACVRGTCSHLAVLFDVVAPDHQADACTATLTGTRSESFEIPPYCDGGCTISATSNSPTIKLDCPSQSGNDLSLTECDRNGEGISFVAEGKQADALFSALGSTNVVVSVTCGDAVVTDGGQSATFQTCER